MLKYVKEVMNMMTTIEARLDPKTAKKLIVFEKDEIKNWSHMGRLVWHI